MPNRPNLPERVRRGPPLLLDGATGTELEARGVRSELPLWSTHALLEAPAVLASIHRDYARAGAEALSAASFRTQRRTLERAGLGPRAAELCAQAVALARRAGGDVYVLGSAPPLEDCYRPDLVPDDQSLRREHGEHASNLAAAGADAILAETHNSAREARAAVGAAAAVGLPAIASFVCGADACLLSGEPLAAALDAVVPLAPVAVGVNCLPPSAVEPCLEILAAAGVPFGVYANLGAPGAEPAAPRSAACSPLEYATHAQAWLRAGARFVGGCCGTTPAHVSAVATQQSA